MRIDTICRKAILQSTAAAAALIISGISIPALANSAAEDFSEAQESGRGGHDSSSHGSDSHDAGSDHGSNPSAVTPSVASAPSRFS